MRRFSQFLFSLVVMLTLVTAGCQSDSNRLGPSGLPRGHVAHVVVIWMTDRGDEFAKKEIFKEAKKLEHVSGVVSLAAGRVLPSDRAKVDNTYDIALLVTFSSESDLKHYTEDKAHTEAMANIQRYAREIKVYDLTAE